ncbi:MAG: TolC family protein [Deltaproteobacteria bacterium]|nr:TolC family protein [Deltaproteobacteria bacterium]
MSFRTGVLVALAVLAAATGAAAAYVATDHVAGAAEVGAAAATSNVEIPLPPVEMRLIEEGKALPVDLETALAIAAAGNLDLLEARARLAEARGVRNEALGALLPQATASFTAKRIDGEIQASFGDLERHAFSTVVPAGGVEVSLNPGRALFEAIAAHRGLAAASSDADQVTQDVLASVAQRYFRLEESQALVSIAERALAASRELARLGRDRESEGAGLKVDVLRADARAAADEVRLAEAHNRLRDASLRLALTLKLDPTVTLVPRENVVRQRTLIDATQPLQVLTERARGGRAELAAQRRRIEAAESRRNATWADAVGPSVYGTFEESAIGRSLGDLGNRQIYGGFIGLRLAPASIGRVQTAQARVEQVRLVTERLDQQIAAEVIEARDRVLTAAEQIEAALRGVRAAEAAEELSHVRFKDGVGIGLEVLDADAALSESRTSVVSAIIAYDAAQVQLLRAVGAVSPAALLYEPNGRREGE